MNFYHNHFENYLVKISNRVQRKKLNITIRYRSNGNKNDVITYTFFKFDSITVCSMIYVVVAAAAADAVNTYATRTVKHTDVNR